LTLYPDNSGWTNHRPWSRSNEKNSIQPRTNGSKRKSKKDHQTWKTGATYRIPSQVHSAIKELAEKTLNVPVGEVAVSFFIRSLEDFQNGSLNLYPRSRDDKKTLFPR
jgi:hypothetical protein